MDLVASRNQKKDPEAASSRAVSRWHTHTQAAPQIEVEPETLRGRVREAANAMNCGGNRRPAMPCAAALFLLSRHAAIGL